MKEVHAAGGTGCSGGICGGGRRRAYFHEELVRCYMRKWWDAKEAKAQLSCVARAMTAANRLGVPQAFPTQDYVQ